ncbi:helix-turn-helix domain-containing protein [Balneolales bacterium ANBcel1]|nr:helix-turn-helix domain-containing protein [Balneolales bacterium ANBcel1]
MNQLKSRAVQYKARIAIDILLENVESIPNVQVWADKARMSRRWLCRSIRMAYGKSPKEILREVKFEKVVCLILDQGLEAGCYSVGIDSGFKSASGLSKFLSAYHNVTFTELKNVIIAEGKHLNFHWLKKYPKQKQTSQMGNSFSLWI